MRAMRIWLHGLAGNIRGVVIVLLVVGLFCAPVLLIAGRRESPIVRLEEVGGEVVSFRAGPTYPKLAAGRGPWIQYSVRLRDGAGYVVVRGRTSQPHALGAEVVLMRTVRENGVDSYTFKETPWMRVGY